MSTASIETSPRSKRSAAKKVSHQLKSRSTQKSKTAAPVNKTAEIDAQQSDGRRTKQELVLTLLSRSEGASVAEMMDATNWQQHSVRGFLAGTVKKKLGFTLNSSKAPDDVRRYRIETRRGR
ncbi:MAG: DUF3489 domain-containing protein [Hyphomicrobium sp.]